MPIEGGCSCSRGMTGAEFNAVFTAEESAAKYWSLELNSWNRVKAMTWIKTIPYERATGKLKSLYDRVKGPNDNVDNIMLAHGLRPHTMEGHMALYKAVLHHPRNTIDKWFLEAIGIYSIGTRHV